MFCRERVDLVAHMAFLFFCLIYLWVIVFLKCSMLSNFVLIPLMSDEIKL